MSQENVDLTRVAVEAWTRRDVETVIALMDPDAEWHPAFEGITEDERTYRGYAGMRQYFEDLADVSKESHAEYPEMHDLGDQVLGLGHTWFKFDSGVELDQEVAILLIWRNGKCVEGRSWLSHAEALEAVGLSE